MAKGKTLNRSSGYIKLGNRKSYFSGYRKSVKFSAGNYSTTDRTRFSARIVFPVILNSIAEFSDDPKASFDGKLYGFINIYEALYYSQYRNMIVRMYEEFTIKDYSCKITLDGQGTLVNPSSPQTTFYLAQDRNGIPSEGGFKRPTDYASVVTRAINYFSPFSQYCWNSVSGMQEKSSFISSDLFKPGTGLFNVGYPNAPSLVSFTYSQNQTYSQYMFKPVVLLAVNSLVGDAAPKFNVEIKINIVGRGIRALSGETANVGIMGGNVAQPSDVAAGKVFYNQNGDSFTGISPPPIKSDIRITENNVSYKIEDFTGGYPASSDTEITVAVPFTPTGRKIPIDSLRLYNLNSGVFSTVSFNSLISYELPEDGHVENIPIEYVMTRGSKSYVAYFTLFESTVLNISLNFSTVNVKGDGSIEMYTKYNANNVDYCYFIPANYFAEISDFGGVDLSVLYGNLQSGEFTFYVSSYGLNEEIQIHNGIGYTMFYGGVGLNSDIFELTLPN